MKLEEKKSLTQTPSNRKRGPNNTTNRTSTSLSTVSTSTGSKASLTPAFVPQDYPRVAESKIVGPGIRLGELLGKKGGDFEEIHPAACGSASQAGSRDLSGCFLVQPPSTR